ncbi:EAL domain-containing protein [Pseudoalteromonas peptidolytica]|uniref:EAL domain-containing protein n=2 Tax=Pseudoalteromonas TaxID=53246 RepID=UPI00298E987D|nr:EAL domain-containing protein [Pseudoalteromonas peptidolytica]MDW7550499.1 EAL domain-containing protein [Pseudoalteromonas peptidolytica]
MPSQLLDGYSSQYRNKLIAVSLVVLLCLNFLIQHLLHMQIHSQGEAAAAEITQLTASKVEQDAESIAANHGFSTLPLAKHEAHRFVVNERSVVLYHEPVWVSHGHLLIFFNLLFFGLVLFVHRWWFLYGKPEPKEDNDERTLLPIKSEEGYALFALVHWQCHSPKEVDLQLHFQLALVKGLSEFGTVAVKYLPSGALAVTVKQVDTSKGMELAKQMHEIVFKVMLAFRGDLSRSKVKLGACLYQENKQQTQVYQSAKSALAIAQNQVWQHTHLVHLTELLARRLNEDGEMLLTHLKTGQFSLFFQPLFDFLVEDVIVSEALLRVSHKEMGRISAKQVMQHLYTPEQFQFLDRAIVKQVLSVYQQEKSFGKVSINLHINSWLDQTFIDWLEQQIVAAHGGSAIGFELSIEDVHLHGERLLQAFRRLKGLGCDLYLDNVTQTVSLASTPLIKQVKAIKLSYELVHEIEKSAYRKRTVRQIVTQARGLGIPVYAVGIETQSELSCIKSLGVKGAQGHYFSAPLEQLADIH